MRFDSYSYRFADEVLNSKLNIKREIEEVIRYVKLPDNSKTPSYTKEFKIKFTEKGWENEPKVLPDLDLKADFRKGRIQVETQFSNVARYYADILKFQLSFGKDVIDIGVLILPKKKFAQRLGSNVAFSERAIREIEHFKHVLTLPIWIIGVEP